MKAKEIFLLVLLMLISTVAGAMVYQTFFAGHSVQPQELSLETASDTVNAKPVDLSNIDLTQLLARDLKGNIVDLSDYTGKHLIINFWATWCPPCRKEIPLLIKIQEQYAGDNIQVLGIAMDDVNKVEAYMQATGFNYPSLITDLNQTTRFSQALGYEFIALPFTFFINKDGKLIHSKTGELKESEINELLAQFNISSPASIK